MRRTRVLSYAAVTLFICSFCPPVWPLSPQAAAGEGAAVQAATANPATVVPRLVQFSGTVLNASGKPATGLVAITFSLYALQDGGAPLWSETETVTLDSQGHYTAFLGAASPEGLPLDLFTSGSARWLGVAPELPGVGEQSRVLLVGVPYALKAADADTLGGKPASAFVTTDGAGVALGFSPAPGALAPGNAGLKAGATTGVQAKAKTPASTVTGSGTTNYVPLWTGSTTLGNSALFQTGSGTTAKVGIGTTSPANVFQVNGASPIYSTGSGAGLEFQDRAGSSNASGEWYSSGNVDYFYRTDKGNVLSITSAGYVGIGTSSPGVNLQVTGTTSTGNIQIRASNLATSGSSISYVGADANAGKTVAIVGADGLGTGPMKTASGFFGTFTNQPAGIVTNNTERMRVTTTGQVGIGTPTPAATLEVNGTAQFDQAVTFAGSQNFTGPATFTGNTSTNIMTVMQSGAGAGLSLTSAGNLGITSMAGREGIYGAATSGSDLSAMGVYGYTESSGAGSTGVYGQSGALTAGEVYGVFGSSSSGGQNTAGVYGDATATSGETFGLYGFSSSSVGAGAYGAAVGPSVEGGFVGGFYPFGVWGDTNVGTSTNLAAGIVGTADDNNAIEGWNNSPGGVATAYFENDESIGSTLPVLQTFGGTWTGSCTIDVSGNLKCSGTTSAVAPVDNGQRRVALYAMEAPQNWFEDFGSGQLAAGSATIRLDPTFAETVNTATDYHVFLTPEGDCEGLYVTNKTASGFEVRELRGGRSNVAFDYRIVVLRKGYENVRLADETERWKQMLAHVPRRRATSGPRTVPPPPQARRPVSTARSITAPVAR